MNFSDLFKDFASRFKTPLYARYITVFIIWNWDMIFAMVSHPQTVEGILTFKYIKNELSSFWRWFAPIIITGASYYWVLPFINEKVKERVLKNSRRLDEIEMQSRGLLNFVRFDEYKRIVDDNKRINDDFREFYEKKQEIERTNVELDQKKAELEKDLQIANQRFGRLNARFIDYYYKYDNRDIQKSTPKNGFGYVFPSGSRWLNYFENGSHIGCEVIRVSNSPESFISLSNKNSQVIILSFEYDRQINEITFIKVLPSGKRLRCQLKWIDLFTIEGNEYEVDLNNTRTQNQLNTDLKLIRVDSQPKYSYNLKYPTELIDEQKPKQAT